MSFVEDGRKSPNQETSDRTLLIAFTTVREIDTSIRIIANGPRYFELKRALYWFRCNLEVRRNLLGEFARLEALYDDFPFGCL